MALYRVNASLNRGSNRIINIGSVSHLEWMQPEGIAILVNLGKVHLIQTPPLGALAGWQTRGRRLEAVDILTIDDFLEADHEVIRKTLNIRKATVEKYRAELLAWGTVDAPQANE